MPPARLRRELQTLAALAVVCYAIAATSQQAHTSTAAKSTAFDAISIKPNNSGQGGGSWGVWQNGYRAKNTPLGYIILQAYGEISASTERLKGAPSWVMTDKYDIDAKADDATADSWKGMRQAEQVKIAAPLLRLMLEDRCKLIAHTVPTEIQGYALVLSNHPLKLKEAQADEAPPVGPHATLQDGSMIVYPKPAADVAPFTGFRKITMAQFTHFVSLGQAPIVDQTGLKGIYDFDLPRIDTAPPPTADGTSVAAPPRPDAAHMFNWRSVGLEL